MVVQLTQDLRCLLYTSYYPIHRLNLQIYAAEVHIKAVVIPELLHKAALLAAEHTLGAGVVDKHHLLSPVDTAVEMVCGYGVEQLHGGKAKPAADIVWNQAVTLLLGGEHPLIYREDNKRLEIYGADLQRAHNLQAAERLTPEVHR